MRRLLLVCLIMFASVGSSRAATYNIDPTVGASIVSVGSFGSVCPVCTTALETPLYTFSPGDTVDFGTMTLASTFGSHGSLLLRFDPIVATAFGPLPPVQLGIDQFFTPTASCDQSTSTCSNFLTPPPDKVFDLTFTIPASGQIQLAWQGHLVSNVPAVPEPATWTLLLIGFSTLAFAARAPLRKRGAVTS